MYVDSHTHLNNEDLYSHRQIHRNNFLEKWGIWLINIGVNHEYNTKGIQICKALTLDDKSPAIDAITKSGRYPKSSYDIKEITRLPKGTTEPWIYCTIGLHPYEVVSGIITDSNLQYHLTEMCSLYAPYKDFIIGIGECGIDTSYPESKSTLSVQKDLFWQQCDLARQWNLPIIIHSRSNREATHDILKNFKDLTIYFHCRSYTPAEIRVIKSIYSDFYIGFTWNITYPKAIDIRKSLRYLVFENEIYPEHIISGKIDTSSKILNPRKDVDAKNQELGTRNLLIETDAPYLAPQSHRGETNTPDLIGDIYQYISSLLGKDISSQVVENAKKCYKL